MRRKVTKGGAFLLSLLAIFVISMVGLTLGLDTIDASFIAIVGLTTTYITGNVVDNGVKGKYYQEGLKEAKDGAGPTN